MQVFTRADKNTSFGDIAKQADVGPGRVYRHFSTREALIKEVYRNELERLAGAEWVLSGKPPPVEALRA